MTPRYQEFAADPALAAHVQCSWRFEGSEDGSEQAIPPDGRAELIVHCGRPYEERSADGTWQAQPALLFAGQLTRPLVLRSRGEVAVLAVRFTPAGAWAFAGRPMARAPTGASPSPTCTARAQRRSARAPRRGARPPARLPPRRHVHAQIACAVPARCCGRALCRSAPRQRKSGRARRAVRARRSRRAPVAAALCRGRRHRTAHVRGHRPPAPRLRRAARRAVVDLVRARAGGRLLRPSADGA